MGQSQSAGLPSSSLTMPSQRVKRALPTAVAYDAKSDISEIASALPVPEAERQTAQFLAANTSATDVADVSRMAGAVFGGGSKTPANKYTQYSAAG